MLLARHERLHPRGRRHFRTYFIDARGDEAMGSTWASPPYQWWNLHDEYA